MLENLAMIQYNCGRANKGKAKPCLGATETEKHRIFAVQEPAWNKNARSTYFPLGYYLLHNSGKKTRVCFMVSKTIGLGQWHIVN